MALQKELSRLANLTKMLEKNPSFLQKPRAVSFLDKGGLPASIVTDQSVVVDYSSLPIIQVQKLALHSIASTREEDLTLAQNKGVTWNRTN